MFADDPSEEGFPFRQKCLSRNREKCRQFVSLIPEKLSVYRLEPVKKDWNECLVAEVSGRKYGKADVLERCRENQFRHEDVGG